MRIVGTESSPFTRKVRIAALERNLSPEFVVDSPLSAESRVPSLNPLGKVPVLVADDGAAIVDSSLIVAYLDDIGDGARLVPQSGPDRTAVLQWEAIANGVMDAAVLMRMEVLRPQAERSAAWTARQMSKAESAMAWMDRSLEATGYCAVPQLSVASLSMACCLAYLQFRFAEGRWAERFAHVGQACAELEQRPSFKATVLRG